MDVVFDDFIYEFWFFVFVDSFVFGDFFFVFDDFGGDGIRSEGKRIGCGDLYGDFFC